MKRREFINWAGIGLIASFFPVALAACAGNSNNATETAPDTANAKEFMPLGTTAQLKESGFILDEESEIMVVSNNNQLMAVNPICTHQGCTVDWEATENVFVCPCHGAKYAADGKVLAKPAPEPLAIYEVKEENGKILVKVS